MLPKVLALTGGGKGDFWIAYGSFKFKSICQNDLFRSRVLFWQVILFFSSVIVIQNCFKNKFI